MRSFAGKIKISKCDFNYLISKTKHLRKCKLINQKKIKNLRAIAFLLLSYIREVYLFLFLKHMIRQQLVKLLTFHMPCSNLHIHLKHLAVYCLPINYTIRVTLRHTEAFCKVHLLAQAETICISEHLLSSRTRIMFPCSGGRKGTAYHASTDSTTANISLETGDLFFKKNVLQAHVSLYFQQVLTGKALKQTLHLISKRLKMEIKLRHKNYSIYIKLFSLQVILFLQLLQQMGFNSGVKCSFAI